MQTLEEKLKAAGLSILPAFNRGVQRKGAEWFSGRELDIGGVLVHLCWFGNFKTGARDEWRSENSLTADKKKLDAEINSILAEEQLAREEHWKEVAVEAEEKWWLLGTDRGTHPYIENKKLGSLHGARVLVSPEGHPVLLVPMRDLSGKLWNVTRIYTKSFTSDEGEKRGNKFILKGGRKTGLLHMLGTIQPASKVYICEGFSTGASVHEATGAPTVICFDAGNLSPVSLELRARYPEAVFVFAADNDLWTKRPNGLPWNPGREKALAAASSVKGTVILPKFSQSQLELRPTDFNDLHCMVGLGAVTEQLENPKHSILETVPLAISGKGAKARVPEKDICAALLARFDGRIVAYDSDLFIYRNGFWNYCDRAEVNRLKQLIGRLAPDYGIRDIEGAFKYFTTYCPTPPFDVNMFQPTPFAANFENGTLHVHREGKLYKAQFHKHNQDDYLTSKLPFNFPGIPGEESYKPAANSEFDDMLRRIWSGDVDLEDKIRLYKQVLGACLIPLFPIVVMFVGRTRTGKSTLIKLLTKLVAQENVSNVDPSDFHGFGMETMVGKLLNFDTDIDLTKPMNDSMIKKIVDRIPLEIKRKFQKSVKAFIPAVHAFGANDLPMTRDGKSRAYKSRMIIIQTEKFQPLAEDDTGDFEGRVWEHGPEGIICAAVEGLFDLIGARGVYHRPSSNAELINEMQSRNDPIAQFVSSIEQGDVSDGATKVFMNPDGKLERTIAWKVFETWKKDQDRFTKEIGRYQFYAMLEHAGYKIVTIKGVRYFSGLSTEMAQGSNF